MVLIEDSRQQQWAGDKHSNIHRHCKRAGIEVIRTALPFGDYCLPGAYIEETTTYTTADGEERISSKKTPIKGTIWVDTKRDLIEISGNLQSSDHKRIKAECIRSQDAGCQLVILIEEMPPCGMVDLWVPPVFTHSTKTHRAGQPITRANPVLLRKIMETMTEKYGVKFAFCDRSQTGRILLAILNGEYKV